MTCDDLLSRMQVKLRQANYTNLNVDMNKFVNVDTNKYLYNHAIKKTMETQLWKNPIVCPDSNIIMTIPTQYKSKPHTKFVVTDLKKIPERFAWSIILQQIAETESHWLWTKYMFPVSNKNKPYFRIVYDELICHFIRLNSNLFEYKRRMI